MHYNQNFTFRVCELCGVFSTWSGALTLDCGRRFDTHVNWNGALAHLTWNDILSRQPSLCREKGCVKQFERFLHPDAPPALQCQVCLSLTCFRVQGLGFRGEGLGCRGQYPCITAARGGGP